MHKHLVKRKGHVHIFDERKVYASCYAACLSAHMRHEEAEKVCNIVTKEINKRIKNKKVITSNQIFKEVTRILNRHNKDAAFMYFTHRDIS